MVLRDKGFYGKEDSRKRGTQAHDRRVERGRSLERRSESLMGCLDRREEEDGSSEERGRNEGERSRQKFLLNKFLKNMKMRTAKSASLFSG